MKQWHKNDLLNRMYINVGDGKKAAMPRYYKQKIYTDEQRKEISGYQKGEIEKDTILSILSYSGNSSFAHEKNQAISAAREQQKFKDKLRRQTI